MATTVNAFPRLAKAENELEKGHIDRAASHVIQHLREHPNDPRGTALPGSIALRSGALVQAEQFLRRAMALGAVSLDVQSDLARAIYRQERLIDALNAYTHLEQKST